MSQGLLVFILSVLVFIAGAVFINFSVKREEAAEKAKQQKAAATTATGKAVKKAA